MGKEVEPKLYTETQVKALMAPLLAKIEGLELRIAKMQRDSSTSSKPRSSDITKPPKGGSGSGSGSGKKLKPGGQPGVHLITLKTTGQDGSFQLCSQEI